MAPKPTPTPKPKPKPPGTSGPSPEIQQRDKANKQLREAQKLQDEIELLMRKVDDSDKNQEFREKNEKIIGDNDWFKDRQRTLDKKWDMLSPNTRNHSDFDPNKPDTGMDTTIQALVTLKQDVQYYLDTNLPDKTVKQQLERLKTKMRNIVRDFDALFKELLPSIYPSTRELAEEVRGRIGELQELEGAIEDTRPTANKKEQVQEWFVELDKIKKEYLEFQDRKSNIKNDDGDDDDDDDDNTITGEGMEKANEFLTSVGDAFQNLRRDIRAEMRKLNLKASKSYSTSDAGKTNSDIFKIREEKKALEDKVRSDDLILTQKQNLGETRTGPYERALAESQRRLAEKEKALDRAESKLGQSVVMKVEDFLQGFDTTIALVRRYQQALRAALKDTGVNTEIAAKEDRLKLKRELKKTLSRNSTMLNPDFDIFSLFMTGALADLREANFPDSKLDSVRIIVSMAADNATELQISISAVHREILRGIEIEVDGWTKNRGAFSMLYLFKCLRVASSWLAFYLADKLFTEYYKKTKNAAANPKTADLRWFVAIYASFQLVFDLIAIVVMYFVRRIDPDVVSGALILDYAFDSAVVTLMVLSSSVWVADIIQDKKYFGFRAEGKRGVRALRTIMVWLLVIHSLAPYFYVAGPNFTGRAKAKDLDSAIREAKTKVEAKKKAEDKGA